MIPLQLPSPLVEIRDACAEGKPVDELVKITVRALRPDKLCEPAEQLSEAVAAKLLPAR